MKNALILENILTVKEKEPKLFNEILRLKWK